MQRTLSERELDRYCWILVETRNRFYPPDETAEGCLDHVEPNDMEAVGHEHGYHEGAFVFLDEMMEQLYGYGVDVLGRANRYTEINREHGIEFRLDDDPDLYQSVDDGAEELVEEWDHIEVEDLGEPNYVPRMADVESTSE